MKKFSKTQLIIFIISMLFLILSMSFVIYKNFSGGSNKVSKGSTQEMTIDYIDTNYEINLFDEKSDNGVKLELSAKYIGNDEIITEPEISMNIDCYYVYQDAGDVYTDMKTANINIVYEDGKYKGESSLDFGRSDLETYNCAYKVTKTIGKYKVK